MSLCLNLTLNFSLWCPNQNVSGVQENTPAFHQVFLRSKPRFRGIAQIVLAIFQLAFGIVLNFFGGKIYTWYSYIIFWGPPFLIVSGVLAVVAHRVASSKLVRVCYIFHTISILISLTGLVLACIDAFNIYPCGATCGNLPAMTVTGFGAMASMLQPPANENLGFVLPDPPAYFEATFHEPPPFLQPAPFLQPPPYPQLSTTSVPPAFSEVADHLQPPPPYSE
ncbi:membrane-spanning 4-domains subfamily A member 15-like isoform X3 [Ranitomeya imitator]|uniref:membrane-spanning 4-domains subfamily A member 15-like isoform X3 n=1 Tax=Ranitomeya imitator TaxID=111125 RepID=UPI0037E6F7E6